MGPPGRCPIFNILQLHRGNKKYPSRGKYISYFSFRTLCGKRELFCSISILKLTFFYITNTTAGVNKLNLDV